MNERHIVKGKSASVRGTGFFFQMNVTHAGSRLREFMSVKGRALRQWIVQGQFEESLPFSAVGNVGSQQAKQCSSGSAAGSRVRGRVHFQNDDKDTDTTS